MTPFMNDIEAQTSTPQMHAIKICGCSNNLMCSICLSNPVQQTPKRPKKDRKCPDAPKRPTRLSYPIRDFGTLSSTPQTQTQHLHQYQPPTNFYHTSPTTISPPPGLPTPPSLHRTNTLALARANIYDMLNVHIQHIMREGDYNDMKEFSKILVLILNKTI